MARKWRSSSTKLMSLQALSLEVEQSKVKEIIRVNAPKLVPNPDLKVPSDYKSHEYAYIIAKEIQGRYFVTLNHGPLPLDNFA